MTRESKYAIPTSTTSSMMKALESQTYSNIDNIYLIQTKNWNFNAIPVIDSFIYKKYGIKKIGDDCIRYKYTWTEDWGEPILQNYIMANEGYSLEELEAMPFYK